MSVGPSWPGTPLPPPAPLPPPEEASLAPPATPSTLPSTMEPARAAASRPPTGTWLVLVAALASVVGALLPWAELHVPLAPALSYQVKGTEGDGVITLVLGVLLGLAAVVAFTRHELAMWAGVVALVGSALVTVVAAVDLVDVQRAANKQEVATLVVVSVGAGLWLTFASGLIGAAGGIVLVARRRLSQRVTTPPPAV
jgi:hypothetical protein